MTAILAQFKIKPEKQAEAEKALAEMVAAVEANEPGATLYIAHRSQKDPTLITFFEAYADDDAFRAHTATPHFQDLQRVLAQVADLSTVRIERLELAYEVKGPFETFTVWALAGPEESRFAVAAYQGYEGWADPEEWREFARELGRSLGVDTNV